MTQFLLLLSLLLISISSFVFAPIGLAQTLSGFFSSEKDKEILLNLKQEFDENFEKNGNSLRKSYENKKAIIQIAKIYENFTDPPDLVNAYTWYNIAVAQGIKTAKLKRDEVLNSLNEKDLLDAQSLSIKLFNKINN